MDNICCRVLTGPTASGKTGLSVPLAREMGWEIACMDSMQIYRGMNIGTAKPTMEERGGVTHHLLDICDPRDSFSAAAYREMAEALVLRLWKEKKKEVLFVGGTGLYLRAMTQALTMGEVPADEMLRNRLRALAETPEGKTELHRMLEEMDPESAARLPVNDTRRVIRAIEVTKATGTPFARQKKAVESSPFRWKIVSTALERNVLYERINRRVDQMADAGLREEVAGLLADGVPENAQSMSGIGYKEMIPCLKGERSMAEALEEMKLNSRHYAKRQMTFLRREPGVTYVNVAEADAAEKIRRLLA